MTLNGKPWCVKCGGVMSRTEEDVRDGYWRCSSCVVKVDLDTIKAYLACHIPIPLDPR